MLQVRYQVEHFTSGLQDVNNDLFIISMPLRELVKVQFKNITREITEVIAKLIIIGRDSEVIIL